MAGRKNNLYNQSERTIPLDAYHSFLKSLVGQQVQVYKGGPESKQGTLLDVQSDYICLLAQNNNNNNNNSGNNQNQNQTKVVYYRTQHLQSISENSKSNSMPRFQNDEGESYEYYRANSFDLLMGHFIQKYVQINLGGPESKTGVLLDTSGSYVAILTDDDGVVYYNVQHIKSISEYNNSNDNNSSQDSGQQVQIPEYFRAQDFHNLFGQMSHKWVSINRGGPEAIEGVLVQGMGGHYTVVSNDEVLRINPYHIKSISCGPKGALKQNNNQQQNNTNSNEADSQSKEESRSKQKNNRSSGKRSDMEMNRTSSSSDDNNYGYERVVKKIDYVWNPR